MEEPRDLFSKAMQRAPQNKAVGSDELFVEALDIDQNVSADVICALWSKCEQLKHILKDWNTEIMASIFKNGDKTT